MILTHHLLVSGVVQGVGYRQFCREKARILGVTGWVRNLRDSRVEALIQGTNSVISDYKRMLDIGPARAKVEDIKVMVVDKAKIMKEFEIREDGESPCQNF